MSAKYKNVDAKTIFSNRQTLLRPSEPGGTEKHDVPWAPDGLQLSLSTLLMIKDKAHPLPSDEAPASDDGVVPDGGSFSFELFMNSLLHL